MNNYFIFPAKQRTVILKQKLNIETIFLVIIIF